MSVDHQRLIPLTEVDPAAWGTVSCRVAIVALRSRGSRLSISTVARIVPFDDVPIGHRRGSGVRTLTGTFGTTEIAVPRARLNTCDRKTLC